MPASLHSLRRFAQRLGRRLRHLAGRPDNAPWVLMPRVPRATDVYVDFVFALDYQSTNSTMLRLFHQTMSERGLSVLLVNSRNVEQATEMVKRGLLRPHVFLDLCSRPGDAFENLLNTAAACGVYTIRKPRDERWTTKSTAHHLLVQAGLPVPPTVILKAGDPDRELTADERAAIGDTCVIKPSSEGANRGVKLRQPPTMEAIAAARDFNRKDDWLVQKMVHWLRVGELPGYVRVYNICGARSMLWWSLERGGYDYVTWDDIRRYDLGGILDIADRMTQLTNMDFFSTEVAIVSESGPDRFVLIDYCNDQCDLDPEGSPSGSPPLTWATWAYRRFADFTWRRKHGVPHENDGMVCLPTA